MWRTIKALIIRNQISNLRAFPWSFTFGHIIGGAYLVLVAFFSYHYLIRGQLDERFSRYIGSHDYMTYIVIGGILSSMSISMMMNVSRALITEWREGTLEVVLLAPANRAGYFIGIAIQQLYRLLVELVPVLLLGFLIGIHFPAIHLGSVIVGLLLFLLANFSMALVLGAVMLFTRDTYLVQNTLFSVTTLVCGFMFPTQYLPHPLQALGQIFPLTNALMLFRQSLLTGDVIWNHAYQIIDITLLSILFIIVGATFNRRVEKTYFER